MVATNSRRYYCSRRDAGRLLALDSRSRPPSTLNARGADMRVHVERAITILALAAVSACSNESHQLTGPSLPGVRLDFGTEGTAAIVCVSGDSPAGNYTFTVSNVVYAAGGSTVPAPNSAVVSRGSCFALVTRLIPENDLNPTADPVTTITYSYTSNDAVGGAGYSGTTCVDDPPIPTSSPCGKTVVAHVNFVAGTTATFSFLSGAQLIESLRSLVSALGVKKGAERNLNDILDSALKGLGKGKSSRACNELKQFVTELAQATKKIGNADTAPILAKVDE